ADLSPFSSDRTHTRTRPYCDWEECFRRGELCFGCLARRNTHCGGGCCHYHVVGRLIGCSTSHTRWQRKGQAARQGHGRVNDGDSLCQVPCRTKTIEQKVSRHPTFGSLWSGIRKCRFDVNGAAKFLKQVVPVPKTVELQGLADWYDAVDSAAVQTLNESVQFLRCETKPRQCLVPAFQERGQLHQACQIGFEEETATRMMPLEAGQRV